MFISFFQIELLEESTYDKKTYAKYNNVSFLINHKLIVSTIFFLISNEPEFSLVGKNHRQVFNDNRIEPFDLYLMFICFCKQ